MEIVAKERVACTEGTVRWSAVLQTITLRIKSGDPMIRSRSRVSLCVFPRASSLAVGERSRDRIDAGHVIIGTRLYDRFVLCDCICAVHLLYGLCISSLQYCRHFVSRIPVTHSIKHEEVLNLMSSNRINNLIQ